MRLNASGVGGSDPSCAYRGRRGHWPAFLPFEGRSSLPSPCCPSSPPLQAPGPRRRPRLVQDGVEAGLLLAASRPLAAPVPGLGTTRLWEHGQGPTRKGKVE